jgi:Spy/CpxP family protein refolding chaperone
MKLLTRIETLIALGAAALVIGVPMTAAAAPMGPGGGRGLQGVAMHLLNDPEVREQTGITDEQVSQMQDRLFQARRDMISRRAEIQTAELDLERLWQADEPDARAIHAAITHLGDLRTAERVALADVRLDCQKILTPEQREKIKTIVAERFRERRSEMGERGERGRGGLGERLRDRLRGDGGPGAERPGAGQRGPRGPQAGFGPEDSGPAVAFAPDDGPGADVFGSLFGEEPAQ